MFEQASVSPVTTSPVKLTAVLPATRHRDTIDRKKGYLFFKRIFDIVFAIFFITLVLSWLLPILCLLIRLGSRGPIFFLQKRTGFGGRSFTCYKLRTMVVNAESDTRQATEDDNRITSIGRFLRKTNIDEFPQFFNVLKGDMSIIGPRPHMYSDCARFAAMLPDYKSRNMVRPGLTGLAQVKGYHGPVANWNCILMRYHWDNYYIHHTGLLMDTGILLLTIWQCFSAMLVSFPLLWFSTSRNKKQVLPG